MSKQGKIYTGIGLLLLAAALFLTGYNLWSDARANVSANMVLEQLNPDIQENTGMSLPTLPSGESLEEAYIPDYILNPEMDMPEEEVDGQEYIGVLKIPVLSLELPIISEWSYPSLRIAPCRYVGSAYLNNMVIAAHMCGLFVHRRFRKAQAKMGIFQKYARGKAPTKRGRVQRTDRHVRCPQV